MDFGTVLVSLAASGGAAAVITNVFSLPKSARSELREMRKDLNKCEGDCAEAKDDAIRARRESDAWRVRFERLEEENERWRLEADYWRKRWEKDVAGHG